MSNYKNYARYKKSRANDEKYKLPSRVPSDRVDTGSKVDKAKKAGIYYLIISTIRWCKKNIENCTFDDCYNELHKRFPTVFDKPTERMNTRLIIESDPAWTFAFYDNPEGALEEVLNTRMLQIASKMNTSDEMLVGLNEQFKKYKAIHEKYELNKLQLEIQKINAENEAKRLDKMIEDAASDAVDAGNTYIDTIIINDGDDSSET